MVVNCRDGALYVGFRIQSLNFTLFSADPSKRMNGWRDGEGGWEGLICCEYLPGLIFVADMET